MCSSLATCKEYKVTLVVADGKGYELKNGVHVEDVGAKTAGRISRMTTTQLDKKELHINIQKVKEIYNW